LPRRLPPLNSIRAFEAAARHLSFTLAATELHVSPSAVSQQIKLLERYLGVTLFDRDRSRGLTLTLAGKQAAPGLRPLFDSLAHVFSGIDTEHGERAVTLLVSPALGATWLAPRLTRFTALHPEIDVRVWVNSTLTPSAQTVPHDLAIYYGEGPYSGLRVDLLMSETVFPVLSPALQAERPIREPADLAAHHLVHDDTLIWDPRTPLLGFPDWAAWLAFAGVPGLDSNAGPRLQVSSTVLEAVATGLGVGLARSCVALGHLKSGRLVRPLEIEYPRRFPYYLVCEPLALERLEVARFHTWLMREGRDSDARLNELLAHPDSRMEGWR
jgi:LysR family glycine cleavage system transcriptional activator